jgi:predicted component of type VI protein secretion system
MAVELIVLSGVHRGRRIRIEVPEFLIGRAPGCHLRPASKDVGWQHCAILSKRGRIFLRDETGAEGTLLNRRLLVGGEVELAGGDHIAVGPLLFLVTLEVESPAELQEQDVPETTPRDLRSDPAQCMRPSSVPHRPSPPQSQARNDAEEVLYL